ncbi:MAG: hypothetical protein KAJ18_00505 [Candidatus Omnitrophica bacterium]|nr:hypothetical protein [Candidatus Omnitrophota bacterium]
MGKVVVMVVACVLVIGNSSFVTASPQGSMMEPEVFSTDVQVEEVVKASLKKRTKNTGTLDIYDEKIDAVRNLRMIKFPEVIQKEEGSYIAAIDYRDINSGAIVTVAVTVEVKDGVLDVVNLEMDQIKELAKQHEEAGEKKEYTDHDVQDFMKTYLKQQTKFTGSLMLFDEDNNKLRKLELVELKQEVRRLGTLNISRAEFKDIESGEVLGVDVSVLDKKGSLEIQALRIREIR